MESNLEGYHFLILQANVLIIMVSNKGFLFGGPSAEIAFATIIEGLGMLFTIQNHFCIILIFRPFCILILYLPKWMTLVYTTYPLLRPPHFTTLMLKILTFFKNHILHLRKKKKSLKKLFGFVKTVNLLII